MFTYYSMLIDSEIMLLLFKLMKKLATIGRINDIYLKEASDIPIPKTIH